MPFAIFNISNNGLNLVVTLFILMLVVGLAGADRLHVPRRPAPRLRPVPRRLRDDRRLHPLHRHRRLRDPAAAGVPRGRPRAGAGDPRRRAARAPADRALLPNCEYPVEKNYLRCPNCQHSLKDPCPSCGKPVDPRWAVCPYCESALEGRSRRRAPERRRRPAEERERRPEERPAPEAAKEPQTPQETVCATPEERAGHARRRAGGAASTPKRQKRSTSREPDPDPRQA